MNVGKIFIYLGILTVLAAGIHFSMNIKSAEPLSFQGNKDNSFNIDLGAVSDTSLPMPTSPPVKKSSISGVECDGAPRRALAVMLSSDQEARPLSGISQAEMVFEMPVVEGGITRLMGVFICGDISEIGSVRSARHDFIPLAKGLDAVYAHWGGSHFALDKLAAGIIDNVDALRNPYNAYYRKSGIYAPHNGFSTGDRLRNSAEKLGYRLNDQFEGYPHLDVDPAKNEKAVKGELKIGYPGIFEVKYQYDPLTNSYWRFRGNVPEIDANTGTQVGAKNVAVMRANSKWLEGQYNDVEVEGSGKAEIYRNGETIAGTWSKDKANAGSKLFFKDESGNEIKFVPGSIWVQIIEPDKEVVYK